VRNRDDGSTIPLILGFFLLALLLVAGSIALGQAFTQQRDLQDICDGAATAGAASAADLDRASRTASSNALQFTHVDEAVAAYLARDPARHDVRARAELSADRTTITLHCVETTHLALGALFGRSQVQHTAVSTVRAPLL
jgi:Flp pilus assembly protein TadG